MALVRTVRQGGDAHVLWPKGVDCIEDVPWDLLEAIAQANRILDWYETYQEEDIPPQHIWPYTEHIYDWFEEVKFRHQTEAEIDRSGIADAPGMMQNDDPMVRQIKAR